MSINESRQEVCTSCSRNPQFWNPTFLLSEISAKVTFWGVIGVVMVFMATVVILAFK